MALTLSLTHTPHIRTQYKAKLAEQAERYEEMVKYMKEVTFPPKQTRQRITRPIPPPPPLAPIQAKSTHPNPNIGPI